MIPARKIVASYGTLCEMMRDREILDQDEMDYMHGFGPNELTALANKGVFSIDINKKINIMFYVSKFKMQDFKPHLDRCASFDLTILVVADPLTTANLKAIAEYQKKNDLQLNLQVFTVPELLFNVTKHTLVPKHEVIKDEELAEELVKRFNVKNRHQLPLILKTDPIARYYGIKPGQVVKITRISPSAGEYIMYRCCV